MEYLPIKILDFLHFKNIVLLIFFLDSEDLRPKSYLEKGKELFYKNIGF